MNRIDSLKHDSINTHNSYQVTSQTKDSLKKVNWSLSKFKTLSEAMIFRDSVKINLPHTIGEIVRLKNDSSKVVVTDVLIGGGKYNYYIEYKILKKDNSTDLVSPEIIY